MKNSDAEKNQSSNAKSKASVFNKMFISFAIVPVVPIIALLYFMLNLQQEGEQLAERNLIASAESAQADIDDWVNRNVQVSNLVSTFEPFQTMDADQIKPFLKKIVDGSEGIYVSRVDSVDGWAVARSDEEALKNYSSRVYFKDVISGKSIGQQVVIGKTHGKPILCFSVPIKSLQITKGVLNQCGFLTEISKAVADLRVGTTGFAFLVDSENQLIATGNALEEQQLSSELKDMSDHPFESIDADTLFNFELGGKKVAYKTQVGLGWTLIVQQDYEEAYSAPLAVRINAIFAIILTALVCLLLIYLMSRAIAKPIDEARQETTNILESVNDGLLLIDKDYTVGKQQSSSLKGILRKDNLAGSSFVRYLNDALPISVAEMAKDYIDLLFSPKIKESLVQTRNPLQSVQASLLDENYQMETRHLNMSFKRIYEDGEITNLLVTAKDITQETILKAELVKLKEEKNQQVNLLAEILYIPAEKLNQFISETNNSLNHINNVLEQSGSDTNTYKQKVRDIYKIIHKVKGDASSIKFDLFANKCHEFEEELDKLQHQGSKVSGEVFLPLTVALEDLFESCNMVQTMLDKMSLFTEQGTDGSQPSFEQVNIYDNSKGLHEWADLTGLVSRLAEKYGKYVEIHFQGFKLTIPGEYLTALKSIANQLVRNSLVHGIESPEEREHQSKIKEGQITLSLKHSDQDGYVFTYKDDGEGIDFEQLRQKIIARGLMSESAAERLSERDLVLYLFKDGFSSIDVANVDAGRGVGLSLVADKVLELKGKINAASIFGKGFILKVKLPELADENVQSPKERASSKVNTVNDAEEAIA